MAVKKIAYDQEARERIREGIRKLPSRSPSARGPQRRPREEVRLPTVTKDGVTVAKEIELEDPTRTWAPRWSRKSPPRPPTSPATAPPPPPCSPRPSSEGLKNVTAGANPMASSAASTRPSPPSSRRAQEAQQARSSRQGDRPGRHHLAANHDDRDRQIIAEAMDKVGKDGVITVEEARPRDRRRVVEGMQFDKGYLSPLLRHRPERMEACSRTPTSSSTRRRSAQPQGPAPAAREGRQSRQAAADHRRGRRGRGPGHPGRQQAARRAQGLRGQGPGLRRPPQGHARGHRRPHRRPGISEDLGIKLENRRRLDLGRPRRSPSTRTTPPSSRAPARRPTSRAASTRSRTPDREHHQRLRPREAPGAPRQAGRRRGPDQRRRRHRAEMKEKKARVEDALHATRAAVEEGIVPGGGVALLSSCSRRREASSSST
jgi:chaperonin GroEL